MHFLDRIKQVLKRTQSTLAADVLCYTAEEFERKKKEIGTVRSAAKDAIPI